MPGTIFIFEDNPERLSEMLKVLDRDLPDYPRQVEDDAVRAVAWLRVNQSIVTLMSLDHDMDSVLRPGEPEGTDHGCGRDVADYLETQPPTCPVIIHTTNAPAGDGMFYTLQRKGWPVYRVYPFDRHNWVADTWARQVQELKSHGWL